MSGAEPCTGSNMDGHSLSGLMLPPGARPIEPAMAGPRSDRMSPNRFEATTTSNQSGCWTKCAHRMSMWYCAVFTSGYCAAMAAQYPDVKTAQYGIEWMIPFDFVAEVTWRRGRLPASSKA